MMTGLRFNGMIKSNENKIDALNCGLYVNNHSSIALPCLFTAKDDSTVSLNLAKDGAPLVTCVEPRKGHRQKNIVPSATFHACGARPVPRKEMLAEPEAFKAVRTEVQRLRGSTSVQ